jgi:serine/threonine-protein kinase
MPFPEPGTRIERYRVEGPLGSGSMGDVVSAVDDDLGRTVAIKILSDRHRDNAELRARFAREGRAVAAIDHPNVVQVFTTGTWDERPYIAMELLRGVDLGTLIKTRGPMGSLAAARAVLDAGKGLQAAARAGLIHRDVKPPNLVQTEGGPVKVTDFGLAKPIDQASSPSLTGLGVVVGTPDYIAPEQARGEAIDQRVDIYALGGTLFCLLTGSPPYRTGRAADDKYLKVVARHIKEPVPDARAKNPSIDAGLAGLARRMMSKVADERPSYPELIGELGKIVERLAQDGDAATPPTAKIAAVVAPDDAPAPVPVAVDDDPSAPHVSLRPALGGGTAVAGTAPADAPTPIPATPSRALVGVTIASIAIFALGLGAFLFGPREVPAVEVVAAAPELDADPAPPDPGVTRRVVTEAPAGMALVSRPDGTPWFYVDLAPVSLGAYAAAFPEQKTADRNKKKNAAPVVEVSFDAAAAHAAGIGKRLLTPDEWTAASALGGWRAASGGKGVELWEWVDDGSRGAQTKRAVRAAGGKADRRPPGAHANVTYRLARDP